MNFIINLSNCVTDQGSSQLSVKITATKLKMDCFYLDIYFVHWKNKKKLKVLPTHRPQ